MSCSSLRGVRPAACTSPTSGSEIFPSDLTGTDFDTSGSFHTLMASMSSLPIIKLSSCALVAAASAFGVGCAGLGLIGADVGVCDPACAKSPDDANENSVAPNIAIRNHLCCALIPPVPLPWLPLLIVLRLNLLSRFLLPHQKRRVWTLPRLGCRTQERSFDTAQSCRESSDSLRLIAGQLPFDSTPSSAARLR